VRAFEQAAEIFFAGDDFRAFLAGEAGRGFVFHLEPFEAHDADVFRALFPDLALAKFHGGAVWVNLPLLILVSRETARDGGYFLPPAFLSATACFFFSSALLVLACFWFDFFWFDFGDLSPIIFVFFSGLIHLRHVSFSGGRLIMHGGVYIVNDGCKIIRQR